MRFKESETVELKRSTAELKEAIISIVAMLNKHKNGTIFFGLKNNGVIVGQNVTESTLREISQCIANNIEPRIYPEIKIEHFNKKFCIKVTFQGHEQPYFAYGRAYIRVADEDRQISKKELENMILKKSEIKWDSEVGDTSINDIDQEILKEYLQKANVVQRISFKYNTKRKVLEKLNLLNDSELTNAARLLFSKKKPIEVQAAVFAGMDKTTFLDIKQFKGNIFELLTLSEEYIKEHMNWRARFVERTREEIPEIPIRAITEALVNAFCHRDYQVPESNKIAIYKDRVEIWNPGNFPEGYKPQDFISQDLPSILRNPLVANTLYLSSDIEKWGSGLKRISEECKANLIKVDFKILKYGFTVQFTRPKIGTVTGIEQSIINLITKNQEITIDEIAKELKKGRRTVARYFIHLKEKGIIKRIGSDKAGYWEIRK